MFRLGRSVFAVLFFAVLAAGCVQQPASATPSSTPDASTTACTADAVQCPDGSYVGRVPPSCEFAPCPSIQAPISTPSAQAQGETGFSGTVLAGSSSPFLDFNKADYDKALASGKLVVLYFYATWCPICREELASATHPAFNELESGKVVAFRVNFNDGDTDENERALASQFGVAYQHTKVFLKNGQRILKSPESWDKQRYLDEINNALNG